MVSQSWKALTGDEHKRRVADAMAREEECKRRGIIHWSDNPPARDDVRKPYLNGHPIEWVTQLCESEGWLEILKTRSVNGGPPQPYVDNFETGEIARERLTGRVEFK